MDDLDKHMMDYNEWFYFLAFITGSVAFLSDQLVMYRQHPQQFVGAPDHRLTALLKEAQNRRLC